MTDHILIVEDETKMARLLMDYLQQYGGYTCDHIDNGNDVMPYLARQQPDLVILDVMLPGTDGLSLARQIGNQYRVPFIMVTARIEEIDRLLGLELGADDYICKPFSPREVVARVKNILRRARNAEAAQGMGVTINERQLSASVDGQTLKLTPVEFALLKFMAGRPGHVFSRNQLMDHIYEDYRVVNDRTVDTHVKNLRKKLAEASSGQDFIESVYGVGYRFVPRGN